MSVLPDIISDSGAKLVSAIGDTIKQFVTTDKDMAVLKQTLEKQVQDYNIELLGRANEQEGQLTERDKADMASDSWLAKNVRPITLLVVMTVCIVLAFMDGNAAGGNFKIKPEWVDLFKYVLLACIGFYFGSRGAEKITKMITGDGGK
jgi:hypothetical protein